MKEPGNRRDLIEVFKVTIIYLAVWMNLISRPLFSHESKVFGFDGHEKFGLEDGL